MTDPDAPTCDGCSGDPEPGSAFCQPCAEDYELAGLLRGWGA